MMQTELLEQAINNNARWCEAVARAHGLSNQELDGAWKSNARMPPFYPNVVSLKPEFTSEEIDALCKNLPLNCGWKDSYKSIDLSSQGFSVAFEAQWYGCSRLSLAEDLMSPMVACVASRADFDRWVDAWGETPDEEIVFAPDLMKDQTVSFFYRALDENIDAGLIANLSGNVVGISNTFGDPAGVRQCISEVSRRMGGSALVGYGDKSELAMLQPIGFEALGPLRIWLR